jgi:quercetin dioxygenase-like cupin family protein
MNIKNMNANMVFRDESLTKRVLHEDGNALSFLLNLKPGQSVPRHGHEHSTLAIAVLRGAGAVQVNEETARVTAGDFLALGGADELAIPEVAEDMSLLVTISPNPSNKMYAKEV